MKATSATFPLLNRWLEFVKWLVPVVEGWPKKTRFNFGNRVVDLALDMVEDLTEAGYSRERIPILKRCNLRLEKLRLLLRLCHDLQYLAHRQYEHAMRELFQAGKMIGGWRRSEDRE